ncbi:MAG TPA: CopG family transcriptional regulator [Solirubrobacterales bacterium]|nr:CopG family transcriptional regulator [Solirubrobacterales bacterium]
MEMIAVELGKLACGGLEAHFGSDPAVGARKALLHYAYKVRVGRRPVQPPRFLDTAPEAGARFELTLDRETEAILAEEAQRMRISRTELATHAVFVYLAELDFLGVEPRQTP